ncbi:MAG: sodium:solute symporter [Candidatus Babeliales bacterium]
MNEILFLALFGILSLIYLCVGLYASRKVTTTSDYFLASRDLGIASVTFTLIATQVGGGMLLGTASKAYTMGIFGIMYTLSMSIGFLILGFGFAGLLRDANIATTAELFATRYHAPRLKYIASLLSIATMAGLLIGQIVASKSLLLGVGIDNQLIFLSFWSFVILYTMIGGLKAVVMTDIAQVLLIILSFGGIWFLTLFTHPLGVFGSIKSIFTSQEQFASTVFTIRDLLPILIMPALFSLIEQDLGQRFFAAKNRRVATLSALLASGFMLLFSLVPIYFGMQAKLLGLSVPYGASPLMVVMSELTNDFLFALAVCGIIAAITSTADSLLCAISSHLMQDFDLPITNKQQLSISRYVTCIAGSLAVLASYFVPSDIVDILIASYEISVCCLFVPFVASFFVKNLTKNAAIFAMFGGALGLLLAYSFHIPMPRELFSLMLSGLGFILGQGLKL